MTNHDAPEPSPLEKLHLTACGLIGRADDARKTAADHGKLILALDTRIAALETRVNALEAALSGTVSPSGKP